LFLSYSTSFWDIKLFFQLDLTRFDYIKEIALSQQFYMTKKPKIFFKNLLTFIIQYDIIPMFAGVAESADAHV